MRTGKTYTTSEVAKMAGIHDNTVRFYEQIGFLTQCTRRDNGYREFTDLHVEQCRLIRVAMRAEVLQNGLRDKAVEIVKLVAMCRFQEARREADHYTDMIDGEISRARQAITTVEEFYREGNERDNSENKTMIGSADAHSGSVSLSRREAAKELDVTIETIRTWERSGLLSVSKKRNGYTLYSQSTMKRLNIIRTLRMANYSLMSILRLLVALDEPEAMKENENIVELLLNTPAEESIVSVCDHLIVALENTKRDAQELSERIEKIQKIQPSINTPTFEFLV